MENERTKNRLFSISLSLPPFHHSQFIILQRGQSILLGACLLLVALLFFWGRRLPDVDGKSNIANMPAEGAGMIAPNPNIPGIDFGLLSNKLKPKVESSIRDSIVLLENKLEQSQNPSEQLHTMQQLVGQWEKANYPQIAAHWHLRSARIDSTEKRWLTAADYAAFAFRVSTDSTMKQHLLLRAINAYESALKFSPDNDEAKTKLASCYVDGFEGTQQVMKGVMMLRDLTQKDSLNLAAQLMLGRMAIVSGQYDKAVNRLLLVTRADSLNSEAYYYLGDAYAASGKKEKALQAFEKCKKLLKNPTFAKELDDYVQKTLKNN